MSTWLLAITEPNKLCKEKRSVGVFPISEGLWIDIGNWDEYLKNNQEKRGIGVNAIHRFNSGLQRGLQRTPLDGSLDLPIWLTDS